MNDSWSSNNQFTSPSSSYFLNDQHQQHLLTGEGEDEMMDDDEVAQYRQDFLTLDDDQQEQHGDDMLEEPANVFFGESSREFDHQSSYRYDMLDEVIPPVRHFTGQNFEERHIIEGTTQLDHEFHKLVFDMQQFIKSQPVVLLDMIKNYAVLVENRMIDVRDAVEESRSLSHEFKMKVHQEMSLLETEKNTWELMEKVYSNALGFADRDASRSLKEDQLTQLIANNAYWRISHKQIADLLFEIDEDLRLQQILIQWLESIANRNNYVYVSKASWDRTTNSLLYKAKTQEQHVGTDDMVTVIDPDAPIRESKDLASDDMEKEEYILRKIWSFIRCGKLEEAQEFCRESKQYWRAATLAGAQHYHNAKLIGENVHQVPQGNQNRFVYSHTLLQQAREPKIHPLERAIYGTLCGDLSAMLAACETWEDYLWAHLKANVEYRFNSVLQQHVDKQSEDYQYVTSVMQSQQGYDSLGNIISKLRNHENNKVRIDAAKTYHIIQSHIALDQIEQVVDLLVNIANNKEETNVTFLSQLLRFACHFVFFVFDYFELPGISGKKDEVTIKYIHHLVNTRQYDLVAFYTSQITSDENLRTLTYVSFLQTVEDTDKNIDTNFKQHSLDMARSAGLNVHAITKLLVERRLAQVGSSNTQISFSGIGQFGDAKMKETSISDLDRKKIMSLQWLCLDKEQYSEAIIQSNYLLREFVRRDKLKEASEIFKTVLPDDILNSIHESDFERVEVKKACKEHICWKNFLEAHERYSKWIGHFVKREQFKHAPPVMTEQLANTNMPSDQIEALYQRKDWENRKRQWETEELAFRSAAIKSLKDILEHRWLQDQEFRSQVDSIDSEWQLLRRKCIPEMVFLLYNIWFKTRDYGSCANMANLVANEYFGLYRCFTSSELRQFVILIKEAELKLMTAHHNQQK